MRRSLHQDRQRARRAEIAARHDTKHLKSGQGTPSGTAELKSPDRHLPAAGAFHIRTPPDSITSIFQPVLCPAWPRQTGCARTPSFHKMLIFFTLRQRPALWSTFRTDESTQRQTNLLVYNTLAKACVRAIQVYQSAASENHSLESVSLSVNRIPSRWSTSCWNMTAV